MFAAPIRRPGVFVRDAFDGLDIPWDVGAIVASMPIRDGGYTYCQRCGSSEGNYCSVANGSTGAKNLWLCKQCYRDTYHANDPRKYEMSAQKKLQARLADVETTQEPSFMERALVAQSLEENEEEILASIEAFGKALNGE